MTFCFKFQCGGGRKVWTKILCSPCFVRKDMKPENLTEWLKASLGECCQEFLFIRTCAASVLSSGAQPGHCFKGTDGPAEPSRAQQNFSGLTLRFPGCCLGTLAQTLDIQQPASWEHSRWPRARVQAEPHWSQPSALAQVLKPAFTVPPLDGVPFLSSALRQ